MSGQYKDSTPVVLKLLEAILVNIAVGIGFIIALAIFVWEKVTGFFAAE